MYFLAPFLIIVTLHNAQDNESDTAYGDFKSLQLTIYFI